MINDDPVQGIDARLDRRKLTATRRVCTSALVLSVYTHVHEPGGFWPYLVKQVYIRYPP